MLKFAVLGLCGWLYYVCITSRNRSYMRHSEFLSGIDLSRYVAMQMFHHKTKHLDLTWS